MTPAFQHIGVHDKMNNVSVRGIKVMSVSHHRGQSATAL